MYTGCIPILGLFTDKTYNFFHNIALNTHESNSANTLQYMVQNQQANETQEQPLCFVLGKVTFLTSFIINYLNILTTHQFNKH